MIRGPRTALVAADAKSSEVLRPFLRGQDFSRWSADWAGLWMIVLRSSENYEWPWADAGARAEEVFRRLVSRDLCPRCHPPRRARKRQDQGRFWWELRSCAYWAEFDKPKIMYPEITWRADWGTDSRGTLCNNTAYFLPSEDPWILATANAPVTWCYSWRSAMHGKDEALRFIKEYVRALPVPEPTGDSGVLRRQKSQASLRRRMRATRCGGRFWIGCVSSTASKRRV